MKILLVSALVAFSSLSLPSRAHAQSPEDRAAAQALFDEGGRLLKQKKYSEACAKLEASLELVAGLGTRGKLAQCYEKLGKTASAWAAFRQVASIAKQQNDERRFQAADRFAKQLEKKLSFVTIAAPDAVPGLSISRDGSPIALGALGTAMAIDPGEHRLEAKAEGYKSWQHSFSIAKKENASIEVPVLEKLPEAPTPVAPALGREPGAPIADPAADSSASKGSVKTTAGLILGGSGGVLIGGAIGLALFADQKWDSAFDDGHCDPTTKICNQTGKDATDSARALSKVSLVMGSLGLAAAATGTYLWLRGRGEEGEVRISVVPSPSPEGLGIAIRGNY